MDMLEQILRAGRLDLEKRKAEVPLAELESACAGREDRPFFEAVMRPGLSLIAEFKRRSPSERDIDAAANVGDVVTAYRRGGASAVSVLTEGRHFGGSLADLQAAIEAVDLPVLRKDFIVDPYMLFESAAQGADAILLIVAALPGKDLERLFREARSLDLDCLVEVRDRSELERALELEADLIGINNRNLTDMTVDISTTFDLLTQIPTGKAVTSESGITSSEEVEALERVGVDAVLVGTHLMRQSDKEKACRELIPAHPEG